jgi:drug/metabolite transporter (DMT)-like permease
MPVPIHIEANAALGLLAALLWGGGDFAGSMGVKHAGGLVRSALLVVLVGHLLSLGVIATLAIVRGDTFPHGSTIAWGVCGGVIAGISLVAFYMALAKGHMGSAAAVSGLLCAAIPAVVSGFTEGAPGWHKLVGFVLAGSAIWLIASSSESATSASRSALVLSTLSGIGFGFYFVSLKFAGEGGLLWPMGLSRIGSSTTAVILLIVMSLWPSQQTAPIAPPISNRWFLLAWIVAGSALDSGGNLSFLAATRTGRLDVAAVLASIYPASTILLAAVILKERTTSQQRWGMVLALSAVVLITL